MTQENTTVDDGADPAKYEVGARLRFTGHAADEPALSLFAPGDVLVVESRNWCGMGIDACREPDGLTDMVWPEEVELLGP